MTTYEVIQHQEVGAGGAASIEFTAIPQTYTDLVVLFSGRTSVDGSGNWYDVNIGFNGSTASMTQRVLYGSGSAAASLSESALNLRISDAGNTANTFANSSIYIPNYTSSAYKSVSMDTVSENNATGAFQGIQAGLWSNTAAITSLALTPLTGNLVQYSSATLIGITSGSDGITSVS